MDLPAPGESEVLLPQWGPDRVARWSHLADLWLGTCPTGLSPSRRTAPGTGSLFLAVLSALLAVGLVTACKDGSKTITEPVTASSIELTSPLGALLDVGTTHQLAATAKDQAGQVVGGVTFTWTSSDPSVVQVDASGSIEALDVGTATIRAAGGGASGTLDLRVVDADLAGIAALSEDRFVAALVAGSSADMQSDLEAAMDDCNAGAAEGRLEAIEDCVAAVRSAAASVSDPTDRALLAILGLFLDGVAGLLNL